MSRKIGALWARESKSGKTKFLSGVIQDLRGDIYITVFKNDRKEKDNQPDYNIVVKDEREERSEDERDEFFEGAEVVKTDDIPPVPEEEEEKIQVDKIPF